MKKELTRAQVQKHCADWLTHRVISLKVQERRPVFGGKLTRVAAVCKMVVAGRFAR